MKSVLNFKSVASFGTNAAWCRLEGLFLLFPLNLMRALSPPWLLGGLLLVVAPAVAAPAELLPPVKKSSLALPPAEQFVQVCTSRLELTEEQRTSLRTYLEQEMEYMAVQAANHSPAEVAELIPAEREQLQKVAGHLLSPGQLRRFRELEATPKMQAYLRQMALAN